MYKVTTMTQIQSFESEIDKDLAVPKMQDIFLALSVSLELAENLFSRLVKSRLRGLLNNIHQLCDAPENIVPCWVTSNNIVLHLRMDPDWLDRVIQSLLRSMTTQVHEVVGLNEGEPLLLGAARTKIHGMGGDVYNFSIRLTYAIGHLSHSEAVNFVGGTSAKG